MEKNNKEECSFQTCKILVNESQTNRKALILLSFLHKDLIKLSIMLLQSHHNFWQNLFNYTLLHPRIMRESVTAVDFSA